MKYTAILLDRDGVVNVDYGHVGTVQRFQFVEGAVEALKMLSDRGLKLFIVTNQAGIGRGFYSEQQFHQITSWMCKEFMHEGASIDKVYFSPFHPTEGLGEYKKDDFSRKPNPGMILQAQQELGLDLGNSILIGDKARDIQAGIAAGLGLNILFTQEQLLEMVSNECYVINSLLEALPFINTYAKSQV